MISSEFADGAIPIEELRSALDDVPVCMAVWTPHTHGRARWYCYLDDRSGTAPDPTSTELAATTTVVSSRAPYSSREALRASLDPPDPESVQQRRRIIQYLPPGASDSLMGYRVVAQAVDNAAKSRLPLEHDEWARLALALADTRVRDAALGLVLGDLADAAKRLWQEATRQIPAPHRAAPATLLALAAYVQGDGALAHIALDCAQEADPQYNLAKLMHSFIDSGLTPTVLKEVIKALPADNDG